MKPVAQASLFVGVALVAALAGFLLYPGAREAQVDADALLATSLPDLDGHRRQVADWRSKVLVVNFWATWCPPCLEEIPGFVRMQKRFEANGLQFIGIAVDHVANVREFAKKHGINYPILIGHAGAIELSRRAGNLQGGLPFTVVLDREARVLAVFQGALTEDRLAIVVAPALR
jgi:peroxiredoxin